MKLKLTFFRKSDDTLPSAGPLFFEVPVSNTTPRLSESDGEIPGHYSDLIYVESSLEDTTGIQTKGLYKIKLAYKPDYEPIADKEGAFVVGENNRFQLFRGADGKSILWLLKRNTASAKSEFRELAKYSIDITPSEEKQRAMRTMVEELLVDDPSSALSELEGLSMLQLERRWKRGLANREVWDPKTKCEELEKLMQELEPNLEWIRKNFASCVIKSHVRLPRNKIRKYSPKTFRDIARFKDSGNDVRLTAPFLKNSNAISIHRAIKDFLLDLRQDTIGMFVRIGCAINERSKEQSAVPKEDPWRRNDLIEEIRILSSYRERAKRLATRCAVFLLAYYPWSRCRRVSISLVSRQDIPNTAPYIATYDIIQRFYKLRFFEESLLNGLLYIPEYIRRDEDGIPSVWQRNYSSIYEYWVFKRLREAFSKASGGFRNLDTSFRSQLRNRVLNLCLGSTNNEPIHATTQTGDLQIDLFHGVVAYTDAGQNKRSDLRPPFSAIKKSKQTPDFAIVFSVPTTHGKYHWLVLDAKSDQELKDFAIDKRNQYTNSIKYGNEPPDQSWLIYSGSSSKVPGIEFDSIDLNQFHNLRWKPASGIQNWETNKLHPVGHIRANVISLNTNKGHDPFLEFAKGQISTARNRLGLS